MPVGRWVSRTAESVVLTPCPPGPGRAVDVDADLVVRDLDLVGLLDHRHHLDARRRLVCRRPWLSNGLIRTSRWVPDSTESVPYAYGALTANVADLRPASSAYDVS